ncbi:signal peptidase II [Afipia clevelandensis]|jgi:signal peptidase II|uniref:Lipoprotein signal peptidase n=2 Tax=Afipia TaxID=1033 RepID=K8NSQ4_9BRAD|nr:signal peptidase II [Afipia clevelandensis]EKS32156.1 signal peptidase II [Afipia clevelandensis ATCC 49720]
MMRATLALAATWYVIDQATKWWILNHLMNPPAAIGITPLFNFVLGWNTGVSFGLFGALGVPAWIFAAYAIAISAALLVWLGRANTPSVRVAIGLVVGGALGNATDRLRHGAVPDFLDFHLGDWHWPAFNMADVGIVCGTSLLMMHFVGHRSSADTASARQIR